MSSIQVRVVSYEDDVTVKTIECESLNKAMKVDSGLCRNLNHDKFYTVIDYSIEKPKDKD